jgi:proton-translocating NADH-quinone oxidoreductase chain L
MYLLAIVSPLLGSISSGILGFYIGTRGSIFAAVFFMGLSAFCSLLIGYESCLSSCPVHLDLGSWFRMGSLSVNWGCTFDSLTALMLITVSMVSFCVHLYSVGYMQSYPHIPRFMAYLSLFTFGMLFLVSADNMLQMLVGWELIGVSSYLLIGYWFHRTTATKSAQKAMIVNRVSDTFLLISIILIWWYCGTTEYAVFTAVDLAQQEGLSLSFIDWICLTMFIGAMGKSAQVFLHVWLPDSMEAATPVSALLHAATLVTAGVYLVVRTSALWEQSLFCRTLVLWVGAFTSLLAATCGIFQNDIKRVIAYSTCSQLGYMFVCCGLSSYSMAMFHLTTHAFFKALLFASAGVVIHAAHDVQDIRKHGGLQKLLPWTWFTMSISSLSLVGWPFLSGFYSKDAVLELCYSSPAYSCMALVTLFTAYYSFNTLFKVFVQPFSGSKTSLHHLPDAALPMVFWIPGLILAIGSVFFGYALSDMLIGLGTDFWSLSINTIPGADMLSGHFLSNGIKNPNSYINFFPVAWLPLLSTFSGVVLTVAVSKPHTLFK